MGGWGDFFFMQSGPVRLFVGPMVSNYFGGYDLWYPGIPWIYLHPVTVTF